MFTYPINNIVKKNFFFSLKRKSLALTCWYRSAGFIGSSDHVLRIVYSWLWRPYCICLEQNSDGKLPQNFEACGCFFFFIMIYKYTFNTHNSWLIIKSTTIRLEHTKSRSIQNGVCLVELRALYKFVNSFVIKICIIFLINHKIQERMNKENTNT